MPAENQNVHVPKGDSHLIPVTIKNQNDGLKPLNLDGAEIIWEVYQEPMHKLILNKNSTANPEEVKITSAADGVASILITEAESSSLGIGVSYIHYVRIKDTLGQKTTVTRGKLFIEK